jgi:hypothetical protein
VAEENNIMGSLFLLKTKTHKIKLTDTKIGVGFSDNSPDPKSRFKKELNRFKTLLQTKLLLPTFKIFIGLGKYSKISEKSLPPLCSLMGKYTFNPGNIPRTNEKIATKMYILISELNLNFKLIVRISRIIKVRRKRITEMKVNIKI